MFLLLNSIYVWLIARMVGIWLHNHQPLKLQVLAVIVCNIVFLFFPINFFSFLSSFVVCNLLFFQKSLFWKGAILSFLMACLVGGMLFVLANIWPKSIISQTIVFLCITYIVYLFIGKRYTVWRSLLIQRQYTVEVTITFLSYTKRLMGFIDSGNHCLEPISGLPVHFVKLHAFKHEQFKPFIQYITQIENDLITENILHLNLPKDFRLIQMNTIQHTNLNSICIRGNIKFSTHNEPCYFVFVKGKGYFPQKTCLLLHVSSAS